MVRPIINVSFSSDHMKYNNGLLMITDFIIKNKKKERKEKKKQILNSDNSGSTAPITSHKILSSLMSANTLAYYFMHI